MLTTKITINKTYDLGGATRLSFNEFVQQIGNALHKKIRVVHVPFGMCYGCIKCISLFIQNPPITADNLLGLTQETHVDLEPEKKDFRYTPSTFLEGLNKMTKMINVTTSSNNDLTSKKNVGIIGLGKMGILHASIINFIPSAKITAVFDINSKLHRYVQSLNICAPFFADLHSFFDQNVFDAVFISVPPAYTLSVVEECAARKINFFVEKPLANNLQNAAKIKELVDVSKVKTCVGYMYSRNHLVKKISQDPNFILARNFYVNI